MENSLLATKLLIPPALPNRVERPRLLQNLQTGMHCSLILVSAPAGFGKTTLLTEWVRRISPATPVAWVSLEAGENDPVRFWDYSIAALKGVQSSVGETAAVLLHHSQPHPTEYWLTALINDLLQIPRDFILVLDDYHFIKSQPIHTGLTFLLENLPPRMHLVIATRVDPPLPLARFRGRGKMLEIRAEDLRFTSGEAALLFQTLKGPVLAPEDLSALNTRAEGWAVGLKMAALYLGQQKDIRKSFDRIAGSQRHIMDYLLEEVLDQQTDVVQDFLLKTSVLERLSAPLCDAVIERHDSDSVLAGLEKANMFLVPLDEFGEWYRYEHLFAELLRHQLELRLGKELPLQLHHKASQWYAINNFVDEAIQHALASRDWGEAMRLIGQLSEKRIKRGEMATLYTWLQSIPEEILKTQPGLCLQYSLVLIYEVKLEAAESMLSYLEQTAQGDTRMLGEIAALQTALARARGDIPQTVTAAQKALALLAPDSFEARSLVSLHFGLIQFTMGLIKQAEPLLNEAYEAAHSCGHYINEILALGLLGAILALRGQLRQAVALYRKAIDLAKDSPAAVTAHAYLSMAYYEWNELDSAISELEQTIELNRLGGNPETLDLAFARLAVTRLAQGDETGAQKALEEDDRLLSRASSSFRFAGQAVTHMLFAILQRDPEAILRWGQKAFENAADLPCYTRHLPCRYLIALGQKAEAARQLETLYDMNNQAGLDGLLVPIRIYQALAADEPDNAVYFISDALTRGFGEGYIRTFIDEGPGLLPLLRKAASLGIHPEYVGKLIDLIEIETSRRAGGESSLLSAREMEVLQLIADGFTDRQIATKLFVSLTTTKTHVSHILGKLDAQSRTQAVFRARELKLI